MPNFGKTSTERLATCHPLLKLLFERVVKGFDCTIVHGYRGALSQDRLFHEGKTFKKYPESLHNIEFMDTPQSLAADVAPWPLDWNDLDRFRFFAGYVKGVADGLGIEVRWGGDWDGDTQVKDNEFNDLNHFELIL
jgi:peptidoglycan LD-endopeptidase CwlK